VLVDQLHGHRPFAHGRGAALGGSGADVACSEDPGDARLEQVVRAGRLAGENEAVGSARDRLVEPSRARLRAEEAEEERERQLLAALQRDRVEPALRSVEGGDLAAVADGDAVALELADQILGIVSCRSARPWSKVTSAPPRASQTAAWPAELPPPTTATREAPHSCASGGPAA
jgi:hypothetical protein